MHKAAEECGVGHITSGEQKGKEVTMESGILPEKMMPKRKMININEYNKQHTFYFDGSHNKNRKAH
jgi:hypothetical protein